MNCATVRFAVLLAFGTLPSCCMKSQTSATPAEIRIDGAKRQIQANSKKIQAYNDLATGYLRRARETAGKNYLDEAQTALAQGLALDNNDFSLQRTKIALLLARHQYAAAREQAEALHHRTPDDVMTYGLLAEADIALGDYPEAAKSTQWMLNLLPNNVPGLLLGARLRVLYGDGEGALEMLNLASTETSPTEPEELAWIANLMAAIQIDGGKSAAAEGLLGRAEQLFPGYPYTLINLSRARLAARRPNDAVKLLQQVIAVDPDPDLLYRLALAQDAAGKMKEAAATRQRFAELAAKQADQLTDASRDLILLYSDSPATAPKALALAQGQIAARHDVETLDGYAWALQANGRAADADAAIQKAMAVGVRSARIFNHAAHIARALKHDADAQKLFELSLSTDPSSDCAADSRRALGLPADAVVQPVQAAARATPAQTATTAPASLSVPAQQTPSIPHQVHVFVPVPPALLIPRLTDTDRLIRAAQAKTAREPTNPANYTALGAQFFQRARETGDVGDYDQAEQALNKSLDLEAGDFSAGAALQIMAEVCMGEHRFADALNYAQRALSLGSGDVSPFAIVGDAYADMGEYEKAAAAYARLTPPNMTLFPRAAYARDSRLSFLRFVAGDTQSAIRLMQASVSEGIEAQLPAENLAWLYYELGEYETQAGDIAAADAAYLAALTTHPGDYRALAALGKLRGNQGRYAEARVLYEHAIAVVPMPLFVAELGDLERQAGDLADAQKQYQLVEYIGLLGHINQVLHNRDLALFYADHDRKLPEALALAHKEFEVRHDVYTWDALAWALYKNGQYTEAANASAKALQPGTRDPLLLFRAGMIAEKLNHRDQARAELREALAINPHFHALYSGEATRHLASLDTQAASNAGKEPDAR